MERSEPRRHFALALDRVPDRSFMGIVGLDDVGDSAAEFGWYLPSHCWGNGYASEATQILLQFGFEERGFTARLCAPYRCGVPRRCDRGSREECWAGHSHRGGASRPSLVGRFMRYTQVGEDTGELRELDRDGPAFSGFAIPAGYSGRLSLMIGRPADEGEAYTHFANALSPGEPLACSGIAGESPSRAVQIVGARRLDVRWTIVGERGTQALESSDLDDEAHQGLRVTRAQSIAPGTVAIFLSDGVRPLPEIELTADAVC